MYEETNNISMAWKFILSTNIICIGQKGTRSTNISIAQKLEVKSLEKVDTFTQGVNWAL